MDFLKGYKTTIGAIGTSLNGLSLLIATIVTWLNGDGLDFEQLAMGAALVTSGLGILGIGKKIERKG